MTALGHGELAVGTQVSEAQLQLLVGMGRDPITGETRWGGRIRCIARWLSGLRAASRNWTRRSPLGNGVGWLRRSRLRRLRGGATCGGGV
ncbi:hypothetical protein [Tessaracoccus sp. OH4464_COT-324]|uniref:hypothetical protein n=1 Tax=Tessaracoccus sp. OH4464_COT-324 TaxID=2491059 RepID=UPI002100E542|nr:hypothetical protein [Tessaracoccus sp. OH4464_COT-324]